MQDGRIAIGDVEVYELTDAAGPFPMPLDQLFPAVAAEQWEPYRQRYPRAFAGPNTWGTRVGCFLVRSAGRTMLVDTGIGPGPVEVFGGLRGALPDELRRHGVDVDGVDLVFLTHMHLDHVGWNLTAEGRPTFPNARYVLSRTDWQFCHLPEVQAALPPYIGPCLTPLEGLGVLVTEAPAKSGALITTDFAAEQGRDIFAVPGSILGQSSAGCHELLKDGAKLVTSAEDILVELNLATRSAQAETRRALPENDDERAMLRILGDEPAHINEIGQASGLPISQVGSLLLMMELKGLVRQVAPGQYAKA